MPIERSSIEDLPSQVSYVVAAGDV